MTTIIRKQRKLQCCYNCLFCEDVGNEEAYWWCAHPLMKEPGRYLEPTDMCAYIAIKADDEL